VSARVCRFGTSRQILRTSTLPGIAAGSGRQRHPRRECPKRCPVRGRCWSRSKREEIVDDGRAPASKASDISPAAVALTGSGGLILANRDRPKRAQRLECPAEIRPLLLSDNRVVRPVLLRVLSATWRDQSTRGVRQRGGDRRNHLGDRADVRVLGRTRLGRQGLLGCCRRLSRLGRGGRRGLPPSH
jgi:hypothetical protein